MPLNPQPLPIRFEGGIETKADSKGVPATKLLGLENAVFTKQTTLSKRSGYRALSRLIDGGSSEYGNAVGMATRDEELLLFADERCYSYRPSRDRWADTGEVLSTVATEAPIARTGTDQDTPDHATNNGVTVVAWADSRGGVRCSVVEAATGRILLADTALDAAGVQPVCAPCGEVLHVYWRDGSGRIWVAIVNPVEPTLVPTPQILVDNLAVANPRFDFSGAGALYPAIKPTILAWADAVSGWRVGYVHPSGVIGSSVTGLPPSAAWAADTVTGPVAVTVDRITAASVAVAFGGAGLARVRWLSTSDLTSSIAIQTAASFTPTRLVLENDGSTAVWWAGETAGASTDKNTVRSGRIDQDGTLTDSSTRILHGHRLASRAFRSGNNVYALVGHEVFYFPYLALVRLSADMFGSSATQTFYRSFVGQWPGSGTNMQIASVHPVNADSRGLSLTHAFTTPYRLQADSANGNVFTETGVKLVTLEMDSDLAYQSAELGRGLYLASGCQQHYDGTRWAEAGFHTAPDTASGTIVTSQGSGSLPDTELFLYRVIYEEIDGQGELHHSAPSAPIAVTITGGTRKVTLDLPTYRLTNKRRVRIGVFRSEGNAEGTIDTIPFYRVTSLDPLAVGDNGYVANDTTVDTISFTDNMLDAVLTTQEPLYTNGGILPNDASPMRGDAVAGGKNRLFWTDATDSQVIRYSQEHGDESGVEMPVALKLVADPYGGRVVALGVMDGAVYAFCETGIYGFGGPGPLAAPDAGPDAFSSVELVTSDCGCKSPNSIVQTPVGIMFQSEKGIKLLDRTRQVIDIGAPVYAYNDQLVTRAVLLPDRTHVLFLVQSGLSLLFDYERGQWSTFTNHEGYDARVVGGRYYYLRTDGRVFVETPGEHRDDNSHIVMRIETAWIKLAGYLQGWQRVLWALFLGEWKSDHTLEIRYRIDYNAGYSPPILLDVNSNIDARQYGEGVYGSGTYGNGTADTNRYQRAVHLNVPGQAISFIIQDKESTDQYGASFELSELLLVGGVLDSRAKIGPARTN